MSQNITANGGAIPSMTNGRIRTNANIKCESENQGNFNASDTDWHDVPYNGGPSMGWKNETEAHALTDARFSLSNQPNSLSANLSVDNKCGGACGRDGTNTGGDGDVSPIYQSQFTLPTQTGPGSWHFDFTLKGRVKEGSGNSTGDYELKFFGNEINRADSCAFDGHERVFSYVVPSGAYNLELTFPKFNQGCHGASFGTRGEREFLTELVISCYWKT